ncbi:MAG: hypothetical protein WC364_05775 [Eubacteriales bacterium]|jgi:hypothetical protein
MKMLSEFLNDPQPNNSNLDKVIERKMKEDYIPNIEPVDAELTSHLEWVLSECEDMAHYTYGMSFYNLPHSEQELVYAELYNCHLVKFHGVQA